MRTDWQSVIGKQYNPAMLADALCKLEGFVYAPSDTILFATQPFDRGDLCT